MFKKISELFSSKNKWFKLLLIIIIFVVLITAKIIDENKSEDNKTPPSSSDTNDSTPKKSEIHIGKGHIVMLIVFTTAYGIDRIIVYKNNLKEERKYNNYEEK